MFSRPARRQRQKGVISVLAASALGVSIIVAALALDLGRVFWIKRDLQKAADLASLSAVNDLSNATAVAVTIANANGFVYPGTGNTMTVTTGIYDWNAVPVTECDIDKAKCDWTVRSPAAFSAVVAGGADDPTNAVQVTVGTQVDYYFLPGSFQVEATAISAREDIASFSLGSFIARLNTDNSPLLNGVLGGLLGGHIALDIGSYRGLAAGNVTLGDLQLALGLGTVDALLKADLTLYDLIGATITALERKGGSVVALNSLRDLQLAVSPALSLPVGQLIKVTTGSPEAAASASVNVLQLIQMAAEVANGKHFIDIPGIGISAGGIASVDAGLSVIEPPSIAIGPARCKTPGSCNNINDWVTTAHTAQVRLKLNLSLVNGLTGQPGDALIQLPLYIEGAPADAALTKAHKAQCAAVSTANDTATIRTATQLLSIYIGDVSAIPNGVMENRDVPITPDMVKPATLVNLPGLLTITAKLHVQLPGGSTTADTPFTGPFPPGTSLNGGTVASLGIGSTLSAGLQETGAVEIKVLNIGLLKLLFDLLGLDLSSLATSLLGVVLNVLTTVLDSLLDPLLAMLGIQLGGADVTVLDVSCGPPQLVY